ncbi:hypothetical protein PABG_01241 [Paracoccidioides brasiliensis Pb03]|nr:hypothetical protein PABG_01241 [Paracoccidioides brasiliensis Pb03]
MPIKNPNGSEWIWMDIEKRKRWKRYVYGSGDRRWDYVRCMTIRNLSRTSSQGHALEETIAAQTRTQIITIGSGFTCHLIRKWKAAGLCSKGAPRRCLDHVYWNRNVDALYLKANFDNLSSSRFFLNRIFYAIMHSPPSVHC